MTDDHAWRRRIEEGHTFDREIQGSWQRVYEGSELKTDRGVGKGQQKVGRPDIRFAIRPRDATTPSEAVFEAKDRDWDRMRPENAKRAVRRDRRQVLRYVGSITNLDALAPDEEAIDVSAALIYRRSPSEQALREWIENYLGEDAIAVLWEDGDADQSEWFARLVRIAVEILQPMADDTRCDFTIARADQEQLSVEIVVRPKTLAGSTDGPAFGKVEVPHATALGKVWLASLGPTELETYVAASGVHEAITIAAVEQLRSELAEIAASGVASDTHGELGSRIGVAVPVGAFAPNGHLLILGVTGRPEDGPETEERRLAQIAREAVLALQIALAASESPAHLG